MLNSANLGIQKIKRTVNLINDNEATHKILRPDDFPVEFELYAGLPMCFKIRCEGQSAPCRVNFTYRNKGENISAYASFACKETTNGDSHV